MLTLLRHLVAIAVLPYLVAVQIPIWISRRNAIVFSIGSSRAGLALQAAGAAALVVGLALFTASLRRFASEGEGTLAPWDPPRRLVVRGPYRFVRNPMISGVVFVLAGEALVLRSAPHAGWAAAFFVLNLIYIPLLEEPMLEARFGDSYRDYRRHVPRFWPRLSPWTPEPAAPSSASERE